MSDIIAPEERVDILGIHVNVTSMTKAVSQIDRWIAAEERRYVCVADVHAVLHAGADPDLTAFYNSSGMTLPDGMPLVWASRAAGAREAVRVSGPDFFPAVIRASTRPGWRHFLVGGDEGVADRVAETLRRTFPGVQIVGAYSPPFRPMTEAEKEAMASAINRARPNVVWFALGAPKQEQWMADYRARLTANVLVGVGAAFALQAGDVKRAPRWMRRAGLEWLYRVAQEPRRLWQRYAVAIPTFGARILRHPPRRVAAAQAVRRDQELPP